MGLLMIQNDFSHGELDRKLFAKVDLAVYNKCGQQLRNVVVIPQGGARRRFGSLLVQSIIQNTRRYLITEFRFSAEINYLFLLEPGSLTILFRDPITGITAPVAPPFRDEIPWTSADLLANRLRFTQTTNRMIITGPFDPLQIRREEPAHTAWSIIKLQFKNPPTEVYEDMITAGLGATNFKLSTELVGLGATLTATPALFTEEYVGGLFRGFGPTESLGRIGVARITAVTGPFPSTTATVDIISEFDKAVKGTGFLGKTVDLEVSAFSVERGWPTAATFYEGRLWFGGTSGGEIENSNLGQTLFGSVVGDFVNFDVGTGDPSDAIKETIATDKSNVIKYLVGDRTLQIFTDSGEFAVPQNDETAITPPMAVRPQTREGITNVEPVVLDNQTFFVPRGGKRIASFSFNTNGLSYDAADVSVLAPGLIRNPVDSAVLKGSTTNDANYLMFVNSDGTLAVFQSLSLENVAAWTLSELEDNVHEAKFQRITQVGETIYAIIERVDATLSLLTEAGEPLLQENGEEILVEEASLHELVEFSFDAFTDSAVQKTFTTPTTVITGLDHLNDKTVHVRGEVIDGQGFFVFPADTVLGGQITLDTAVVGVEVGLPFTPIIQPMPVQVGTRMGQTLYVPKRITRLFIDFYESVGVYADGILIPYLSFGGEVLDQPPQIKTDFQEIPWLHGWDARQAPVLSQNDPVPMTILGIGYEVDI